MSVCRFGWDGSDVYVYYDVGGYISCCGCWLSEESFHAKNEQEMIDHLAEHTKAGYHVPAEALEELKANMKKAAPMTRDGLVELAARVLDPAAWETYDDIRNPLAGIKSVAIYVSEQKAQAIITAISPALIAEGEAKGIERAAKECEKPK